VGPPHLHLRSSGVTSGLASNHRGSPNYTSHTSNARNKQTNDLPTSLSPIAIPSLDSPRISAHERAPHELRHAPAFHTKPHHPHHAAVADTMESVIHEDSPLAEFLEGTRCTLAHYATAHTNCASRRGKRRALCTAVAGYIHLLGRPWLCATGPLHAPVEDKRQAAAATAHTGEPPRLGCAHTSGVLCKYHAEPLALRY
jgi:hypothetical protein